MFSELYKDIVNYKEKPSSSSGRRIPFFPGMQNWNSRNPKWRSSTRRGKANRKKGEVKKQKLAVLLTKEIGGDPQKEENHRAREWCPKSILLMQICLQRTSFHIIFLLHFSGGCSVIRSRSGFGGSILDVLIWLPLYSDSEQSTSHLSLPYPHP